MVSSELPRDESQEKDVGKITFTEKEAEIVQAQQPPSINDEELGAIAASQDPKKELPFSKGRCIALVATVTGASFLNTLGVQASVIILPTIGRALNIPDSRQQWVVSAYNLTFGCFLLLWGRLADVYGKRLVFICGSIWMTTTSIILPFVPNEIGFDIFRGLQGLGAAAMVPTAIGILGVTFPPGKAKNYAFSCYGAGAPLGGIFGNIFGGVLSEYLNWKWVFWVFGILAALCTIAGIYVIPLPAVQTEPVMKKAVDWIGGTIITVGLIVLLFALSEGNVVGWRTPWVPTLETKTDSRPLMKLSIFKNTTFSAANVIMVFFFASFNNFLIFSTYWFQDFQGLSVIQTTIRFIPTGATGVFVCFVTSQLLSRVRADYLLAFGTASIFLSSMLFALPLPLSTSYFAYGFPAMILSVCGADTLFPTLMLFVAKSLPPEDQALGGALINSFGQVGRAIGLAIATAIETAIIAKEKGVRVDEVGELEPGDNALKLGIRGSAWFNCALGIVGMVVALMFFRGAGKVGGKH